MLRSVISLLSSYGILLLANGLFSTIVSLRSQTADFSEVVIGIVLSGYFAGLLISSFFAVRFVAQNGHIRSFALFASLASTAALGHLLWVNPVFWFFLRLLSGFCMGGMIIVTEGWLNDKVDNSNRGRVLSLYMMMTYACLGLSQLMITLASADSFELFIIVSILFSLALMPILMSQSKAPAPASPMRPNIRRLFQTSQLGMIGSFIVGVVNSIFYALTPLYSHSMGFSTQETAIFLGVSTASGMLLQVPLGKLSDKVDRRWVMVLSTSVTAIICFEFFAADIQSTTKLYILGICYGSVAFSVNPICVAHVNDLSPPHERTQTASGLLMLYGLGAICGPIIAGSIMSFGAHYIFLVSGISMSMFACYALLRLVIKPRQLNEKKSFRAFSILGASRQMLISNKSKTKK